MAIQQTGSLAYRTGPQSVILSGQTAASVSSFCSYDGSPVVGTGLTNLVSRDTYNTQSSMMLGPGAAGTVRVQFSWLVGGATRSVNVDLSIGIVHHIAATLAPSGMFAWVDGLATAIPGASGATNTGTAPFGLGAWDLGFPADSRCIRTLSDVNVWNGYTLSAADVRALRDGADPTTIGGSASARFRYTLAGTTGQVPTPGAGGLAEAYGMAAVPPVSTYNLSNKTGTGSAVYVAPLVWVPSVQVREAEIGTCGKMAYFYTETIGTLIETNPTAVVAVPTITINGVNRGSLTHPLVSGIHKYIACSLPVGVVVGPNDVPTFDAPTGWAIAAAGVAEAMVAQPAVNRAGRSNTGVETATRTLKVGVNLEWQPNTFQSMVPILKNRAKELTTFSGIVTKDVNGKPLTLAHTSESSQFHLYQLANGLDATGTPGETGLFAIGWDDLNTSVPTNFSMGSGDAATTTVAERVDLRNVGSGGIGQVRVYNVQRAPGSTSVSTNIVVYMSNANKAPQFDALIINGQDDFTPTPATAGGTVLDNSNPYALSAAFLDRIQGAGSLRCWQYLIGGITARGAEPEELLPLETFSWGFTNYLRYSVINYTRADPLTLADVPYFYSPVAGSKYTATLASDIDASTTTLNISDAATAPVIYSSRLFIGSEVLRATNVVGTTVTVIRGAHNTTPAAHAAGSIQVGYRIATPSRGWLRLTTQAPHKLFSGQQVVFGGGAWPTFTLTNGATLNLFNTAAALYVDGPNTFFMECGNPGVTLAAPVTLNPATNSTLFDVSSQKVPYAFWPKVAEQAGVPNLFVAIPQSATDDMVWKIARDLRDNSTPGSLTFHFETGDEPWNSFYAAAGWTAQFSKALYPGQTLFAYQVKRTSEIREILKASFDEGGRNRGGEIKVFLNVQNSGPTSAHLDFARAQTPQILIDEIADAPYVDGGYAGSAHQAAFSNLDADQCADLFIHGMAYNTSSQSVLGYAASWRSIIDSYNTAMGATCQYVSYEGGLQAVTGNVAKDRDIFYSPAWYWGEQDFYLLCQQAGYQLFNIFALSHPYEQGRYLWGMQHYRGQPYGRGDGSIASDGLPHDNRLCMAQQGLPHSKDAATNQDAENAAVRIAALRDWNNGVTPSPPPSRRRPRFLPHRVRTP